MPTVNRQHTTLFLGCLALVLPLALYLVWPYLPPRTLELLPTASSTFPPASLALQFVELGPQGTPQTKITHVQIVDLDRDGQADLLVCDGQRGRVLWYRQQAGAWHETVLGDADLAAPCHTTISDVNGDGHPDIVVAVLGSVWPTDEKVGRVVVLLNDGKFHFTTHEIADDLRRVADVQVGDLNGDGHPDLVVAEFGYERGRVLWLENRGNMRFIEHELDAVPGCIHVPLLDVNSDGRLDLVALISQDDEEVVVFENRGQGQFAPRRVLFSTPNFDLGTSGLFVADVNKDGRPDLLLTAGDNLEIDHPVPQAWHGCLWLENKGDGTFTPHRIAHVAGVYAAGAGDVDGDGHADVVLACMFNDWRQPGTASVVWLKNDGQQNFTPYQVADRPTHLATLAVGDLNGDGRADIVAGCLPLMGPFDRLGRVALWLSTKEPR